MSQVLKSLASPSGGAGGGSEPEAVSFDGVTDYMSRSSDFVGNTDSKTFTFSCWVYITKANTAIPVFSSGTENTNANGFASIRYFKF